jgi:alkylated DNA repair protein (DNA oxidative demethylase)
MLAGGDSMTPVPLNGAHVYRGLLDRLAQRQLVDEIRSVVAVAPLIHPETRWGKKMSVGMTSAGAFGWISDRRGYRYEPRQPSGDLWPPIPPGAEDVWCSVSGVERPPECCLVNYYADRARMGLHQDKDEADQTMPVVSISLGDDALFRVGGVERGGPTESLWLASGDVVVMGGSARMAYHGVDRIRPRSCRLLEEGGRFNLTLRVVT